MRCILIVLLFSTLTSFSQRVPIEITWTKDLKLTKDYFQLVDTISESRAAIIFTGVEISYNWEGTFKSRTWAYMNTRESLLLKRMTPFQVEVLLNHEKRHFDIAEYISRCINAELRNVNTQDVAIRIYNKWMYKLDSMQSQYDRETDHCINVMAQLEWDAKMDKLLNIK